MTKNTSDQDSNVLTQDAYAGIKVKLEPASLLRRGMAYSIDLGFAGILCYIVIFIAIILISGLVGYGAATQPGEKFDFTKFLAERITHPAASDWMILFVLLALMVAVLAINHGYFIWHEYKTGITPGKRFMGLKVISMEGGKLTLKQCVGREALRYIDCTLFIPGILTILLTGKNQRLGDLFAGTLVIYSRALENEIHYLYLSRENFLLIESQVTMTSLTSEDEDECMQFAYQYLVRKVSFDESTLARWEKFAEDAVQANADFPMHPQDKLLFVAEFLRQKSIARKPT